MVSLLGRAPLAFLSICKSKSTAALSCSRRAILLSPLCWSAGLATVANALNDKDTTINTAYCSSTTTTATRMQSSSASAVEMPTGYLNAENAAALDGELMSTPGFSLEQLMELAGLSVAEAVYTVVQDQNLSKDDTPKVLVVCGPGNNGGDGLVAARHLVMFGYECTIVYPKQSSKEHFINLVQQCKDVGIEILTELPHDKDLLDYNAMVDSIFGFSFKGKPREPYASILATLYETQQKHGIPTISVDIPSGWNVDSGDEADTGFVPDVLISLTAPKLSAKHYKGRHFVGGRFLPPKLANKYGVKMPPYQGVSQVWEQQKQVGSDSWEEQYAEYLAEKEAKEFPAETAVECHDEDSWEVQYAQYLAEKEAKEFAKEQN